MKFFYFMSKTVKNAAGWHFTRRSTTYTSRETAISKHRKFGHLAAKLWNIDQIWKSLHVENCIENLHVKYEANTFSIKGVMTQNVIFRIFDLVFDLWPTFEIFGFYVKDGQKCSRMTLYTTFYDLWVPKYSHLKKPEVVTFF